MGVVGGSGSAEAKFELAKDDDGSVVVRLRGDLDMSNEDELAAAVDPVIADSPARLVLDVSGLRFADSAAIALWVRWANDVGELELRHPSALLRRMIETMGLAERLHPRP